MIYRSSDWIFSCACEIDAAAHQWREGEPEFEDLRNIICKCIEEHWRGKYQPNDLPFSDTHLSERAKIRGRFGNRTVMGVALDVHTAVTGA